MNHRLKPSLVGAVLTLGVVVCYAKTGLEDWRTTIACGGQQFEVISRCRTSAEPMELNICEAGQRLTNGKRSIRVPTRPATKGKPVLYATLWSCLETSQGPILRLNYFAGHGRTADDEAAEFFDSQLRPIKDPIAQRKLYKLMPQAKEGYVKSIMPD